MASISAAEHQDVQADLILSALAMSRRKDWLTTLVAYQFRSAQTASRYLPLMLDEHDIDGYTVGTAAAGRLLGVTGAGYPARDALDNSPTWEQRDRLMMTILADTARQAMATGIAARPAVTGYVRVVEAGACNRCVVLAGRFYRWNEGFLRHPRCRCTHEASNRRGDAQNPGDLFDAMTVEEQDRTFGKAGAEAIRMGADISRVVNARAGVETSQVFGRTVRTTTVGTGRRRIGEGFPRLMPESILAAAESREHALAILRRYGYLI